MPAAPTRYPLRSLLTLRECDYRSSIVALREALAARSSAEALCVEASALREASLLRAQRAREHEALLALSGGLTARDLQQATYGAIGETLANEKHLGVVSEARKMLELRIAETDEGAANIASARAQLRAVENHRAAFAGRVESARERRDEDEAGDRSAFGTQVERIAARRDPNYARRA